MPLPGVGLGLADPVPQGLRMHVELLAQPPERRPRGRLPIQPNRTLTQLVGVLPRCWQQSLPPWSSRSNQSWETPENRGNLTTAARPPTGRGPAPALGKTRPPGRLTPARVRRAFRNIR